MPSPSPQPETAPETPTQPANYYYYGMQPGANGSPGEGQNGTPGAPVQMMYGPPPPGVQYWPPPGYMAIPVPMHMAVQNGSQMGNSGKPKRRQVKNACTNCQTACKRCEDTRPCTRCVKYGLGDSCVNSARKERKKGIKRGPYKKRKAQTEDADGSIQAAGMENMGVPPPGTAYPGGIPPPGGFPADGGYYSFYPSYAFPPGGPQPHLVPVPSSHDGGNGGTDNEEEGEDQGDSQAPHYYQQMAYAPYFHPPPNMVDKKEGEEQASPPAAPAKKGRKRAAADGEAKPEGAKRGRKRKVAVAAVPVHEDEHKLDNPDDGDV